MSAAKNLEYVRKKIDVPESWERAVQDLCKMNPVEIARVWVDFSNISIASEQIDPVTILAQRKMLLRLALLESQNHSSNGLDGNYISDTLQRCIPLCKDLQKAFVMIDNLRIYTRMDDDVLSLARSETSEYTESAVVHASRPNHSAPQSVSQLLAAIENSVHTTTEHINTRFIALDERMASMERKLGDILARPPAPAAAFPVERVVALEQGLQRNTNEVQKLEQAMNALTTTLNTTLANIRRETAEALQRAAAPRRPDDPPAVAAENSASSVGSGGSPARRREGVRRRDSDGGARRGPEPVWNPANGSIDHRRADNALLDQGSASVPGRPGVQRGMASTFGWPDSPPWSPI